MDSKYQPHLRHQKWTGEGTQHCTSSKISRASLVVKCARFAIFTTYDQSKVMTKEAAAAPHDWWPLFRLSSAVINKNISSSLGAFLFLKITFSQFWGIIASWFTQIKLVSKQATMRIWGSKCSSTAPLSLFSLSYYFHIWQEGGCLYLSDIRVLHVCNEPVKLEQVVL